MLRKISILLLFIAPFLFSACINVLEEMTLQSDGSGTYLIRYDLSALMSDPTMQELLESSLSEEDEGAVSLTEDVDTIMSVYDNLGPGVENREFWKKVNIHMVLNEARKEAKIDILLNFASLDEVAYMYENLSSLSMEGESMTQFSSLLKATPQFSQKKNVLIRKSVVSEDREGTEEDLSMVEMLLTGAKYTCMYHLPGKVSSCKIPNSTVEGNTVTVENTLLDAIKGEARLDGSIKYK
jgi:hypothetical protein